MDIVKATNTSYAKYEEVLIRRDNLRKEAEIYHLEFIMEFGDLITESFRLKIECIRKKKMISYCQRMVNQGKRINQNALTAYIEKEMQEYQAELDDLISDVRAVKKAEEISPLEVKKIKDIYYALVKLIHPDLHPELVDDEIIKEYWQRIVIAYSHNCLGDIEELNMLVRKYLETNGIDVEQMEVEDVEEKIIKVEHEIEDIVSTNPYLYRMILTDENEIEDKRREYVTEIESYRNYSDQLEDVLSTFEIKEMLS